MSGSSPNWTKGYIPSASEWNSWWAKKLDTTYIPPAAGLPLTGGSLTGTITSTPGSYHGSGTNDWTGSAVGLYVNATGSTNVASTIGLDSQGSSYQLSNYQGTFYIAHMPSLNDYTGNVIEQDLFSIDAASGTAINTDLSVAGAITLVGKTTAISAFSFGNSAAPSTSSLTRHLQLYSTTYGINYTANRMNFVAPVSGSMTFVVNAVDVASINSTGATFTVPLTLSRDPINTNEAATKNYVDAHSATGAFLPLAGGNVTGNITVGTNSTTASTILNGPDGSTRILQWNMAGSNRWRWQVDGVEDLNNNGSSLRLFAFNNSGSLGEIANFSRFNGYVNWNNNTTFTDARHTFNNSSIIVPKTIGQTGTHTYTAGVAANIGGASPAAIWQSVNWAGTADRTGQPALNFFNVNDTMQVNDLLAAQYQQFSLTYAYNAGASGGRSQMVLSFKKNVSDPLGENYIQGLGIVTQVLKGDSYTPGVYRSRTSALNIDGRLGDTNCYFRSLLNCECDLRLEATNFCLWKGHWAYHWAIDDGAHGLEQDFGIMFDRSPAIAPGTGGGLTLIQLSGINSDWPLDPTRNDTAILQLKMPFGPITGTAPLQYPWTPRAGFGFDLWGMDIVTSPFRVTGLTIDGSGQIPILGPGAITYTNNNLVLDVPNVTPMSAIVVAGGNYYQIDDIVMDTVTGSLWKVATLVATSTVGTVTLYKKGYARTVTNPVTTSGGNGTGLTLNITTTPSGVLQLNPTGTAITVGKTGGTIGFNGSNAVVKPTITGSKGANAALTSLLTALANYGLLVDSST